MTKITLWIDKGKPTRVKTVKSKEFFLDDLTPVIEELVEQDSKEKKEIQKNDSMEVKEL